MRVISWAISVLIGGRPMRFDFHAQNRANPRRCQLITVSGFTIVRVSAHRDQTRESTASCCRSARFSAIRLALGRKAERSAPMIAVKSAITCGHSHPFVETRS
jgi:hypothetical protein